MRTFVVCTILVFCFSTVLFGQKIETSFNGEENFNNSVSIPNEVLEILKRHKEVQRCFGSNPTIQDLSIWFEATEIKLNNDYLDEILVKAKDDIQKKESNCLNGNAVSFWIFRKMQNDYDLILYLYTITVEIGKKKSRGYYQIRAHRSTANTHYTTFYAFNGKKYIEKAKEGIPVQ